MDVQVIDHLKHEDVSLKPSVARSGDFLQVAKNNTLVASEKRRGSTATFKEITAVGENVVDGQLHCYVALQVGNGSFMTPKKPNGNNSTTLKVILKKVKPSKLFDKENRITKKSLKYWFILNTVGDGMIYESLAYRGFYLSVEGNKVLMRKCPEGLPTDENYHIRVVPAFNVEVRRHTEIVSVATTERMSSGFNAHMVYVRTEEDIEVNVAEAIKDVRVGSLQQVVVAREEETNACAVDVKPEEALCDHENGSAEGMCLTEIQGSGIDYKQTEEKLIKMSSAAGDNLETVIEIIEEDTTIKTLQMDDLTNQNGGTPLPSDVVADCEPEEEDTGPEVTMPLPDDTGPEVTMSLTGDYEECNAKLEETKETNRKERSIIGNRTMNGPSVVRKGTGKRRSIMSKLFSCVSSRNTSD